MTGGLLCFTSTVGLAFALVLTAAAGRCVVAGGEVSRSLFSSRYLRAISPRDGASCAKSKGLDTRTTAIAIKRVFRIVRKLSPKAGSDNSYMSNLIGGSITGQSGKIAVIM